MWLRDGVRWLALAMLRWTGGAAAEQPDPTGGTNDVLPSVAALLHRRTDPEIPRVIADLSARVDLGRRRYGQPLRAWAVGRDPLIDWAQEQYDAAMYGVQAMLEREDELGAPGGARLPAMLAHRMLMHSLDGAVLARRVLDVAETRSRRALAAPIGPDRVADEPTHARSAHGGQ